jgi:hypothetical protein
MKSFCMTLACVALLAASSVARADTIYAQLRTNYDSVTPATGDSTQTTAHPDGITDTLGSGAWNFYVSSFASDTTYASATNTLLTWKTVPSAYGNGNKGYGGTDDYNLPAMCTGALFSDGVVPASNELAVHPGNNALLIKWTAGAAEATNGLAVSGTFQRDVAKTGSTFDGEYVYVYVAGALKQTLFVPSSDVTQYSLSLTDLTIAAGQSVEVFLQRNADFSADEARISMTISAVPEPSTLALLAGGLVGLIAYAWRKRK